MKFEIKKTGDVIIVKPWVYFQRLFGALPETPPFQSTVYHFSFFSMDEYWMEMGKRDALSTLIVNKTKPYIGISFDEVVERAAVSLLGMAPGVILFNINTYSMGRLKDRLLDTDGVVNEDFVLIYAKSKEAAKKILDKIPSQLAEGYALDRGRVFHNNFEEDPVL